MIRTHILPCTVPRPVADALNLESGRLYTQVLVTHWRIVRKQGHWLRPGAAEKLNDYYNPTKRLHAHTIDAAQQGFYKACTTAKAVKKRAPDARYPHWRKRFRTTIWKHTAIKSHGLVLTLSNGKGHPPLTLTLPVSLAEVLRVLEVRLVYNKRARHYTWHVVVENGRQPTIATGTNIVSVDLGEIHPAVVGDTDEATILGCRERRATSQGHAKRLASITAAMATKHKGSRRYQNLLRTKARLKAKYKRVMRDLEHKVSRAIVEVTVERQAGAIVLGDVRDVADGVNKGKTANQKISQWNHGKIRAYVEYKAHAEGLRVVLQDEHYTSQTCPQCGHRHKPRGRVYTCRACGFSGHRDVVGQINILSAYICGVPGKFPMPQIVKYRRPAAPWRKRSMRRCPDTGQSQDCSLENVRCMFPRSPRL